MCLDWNFLEIFKIDFLKFCPDFLGFFTKKSYYIRESLLFSRIWNCTIPGIVLSEFVLSGDPLYLKKPSFGGVDDLYKGGKAKTLRNGLIMSQTDPPQPQTVGFRNLVGTGIAPVSSKIAVKSLSLTLALVKSSMCTAILKKLRHFYSATDGLMSNSHHLKIQKDGRAKYIPNFGFKWC